MDQRLPLSGRALLNEAPMLPELSQYQYSLHRTEILQNNLMHLTWARFSKGCLWVPNEGCGWSWSAEQNMGGLQQPSAHTLILNSLLGTMWLGLTSPAWSSPALCKPRVSPFALVDSQEDQREEQICVDGSKSPNSWIFCPPTSSHLAACQGSLSQHHWV